MAQIYVGFHDQRNSSRVLKPPGGGTSDIFGTEALKAKKEEPKIAEASPEKTEDPAPKDQIIDSSISVDEKKNEAQPISEVPIKIEELSITKENGESPEAAKCDSQAETISSIIRQEEKTQSPVTPVSEPSERKTPQRVPPGGFSSGLW